MSGFPNNSNVSIANFDGFTNQISTALDIFDRRFATTSFAPPSGETLWSFFTPVQNFTANNITMCTTGTASAGLTLARMGLYSFNETTATLLAQTATDTALFGITYQTFTRALLSSVPLTAGTRYGVAVIQVGTTPASILSNSPIPTTPLLTPRLLGFLTGQTDLTASATPTFNGLSISVFARLT